MSKPISIEQQTVERLVGRVITKYASTRNGVYDIRWRIEGVDGNFVRLRRLDNNSRSEPAGTLRRWSTHYVARWMLGTGYRVLRPLDQLGHRDETSP